MTLHQRLQIDLKEAMKAGLRPAVVASATQAGQEERLGTLRMILSATHNREIEEHAKGVDALTDAMVVDVIRKEAKKRKEAAEIYSKAERKDLAEKETRELKIIKTYLPVEMGEAEIETIVRKVLGSGVKDFGAAMKEVMKKIAGRAEAGAVAGIVKRLLE